jgi:hypothetical protein
MPPTFSFNIVSRHTREREEKLLLSSFAFMTVIVDDNGGGFPSHLYKYPILCVCEGTFSYFFVIVATNEQSELK